MPIDVRTRKLAQLVVNYSAKVKERDIVLIAAGVESIPFAQEIYKEVILKGAIPSVDIYLPGVDDFYYKHANDYQLNCFPKDSFRTVKNAQVYISIDTTGNTKELANADPKKMAIKEKVMAPIDNYIVNTPDKIRRVLVAYPVEAMAQEAEMSLSEYEDFVYSACFIDIKTMEKRMSKIAKHFEKGKKVEIKGHGINLRFSIEGKNCLTEPGIENMPCGEIYMAPVRTSVDGHVCFSEYPALFNGKEIADIELWFRKGKVYDFKASKNADCLKEILDTDKNARYIGEFGIGFNNGIRKYTNNLLFDEKMGKTIHLALGMAYKENGGGNNSAIHWDLVKDMFYADIILDGKIVQHDGKWKI